jgi:hypothetical protein
MLFALYLNAIGILILGQSRGWNQIEGFRMGPPAPQQSSLRSALSLETRLRHAKAATMHRW